jgi:hypothetical protein
MKKGNPLCVAGDGSGELRSWRAEQHGTRLCAICNLNRQSRECSLTRCSQHANADEDDREDDQYEGSNRVSKVGDCPQRERSDYRTDC